MLVRHETDHAVLVSVVKTKHKASADAVCRGKAANTFAFQKHEVRSLDCIRAPGCTDDMSIRLQRLELKCEAVRARQQKG